MGSTITRLGPRPTGQDRSGNGIRVPITNDPTLEGLVLLFQFVAITPDGQDFVASDVFGATILAAEGTDGPEDGGGPRIWATMTEAQRKAALKAGRTWAEPLAKRLPRFERSVYQIVQSMR